MRRDFIVRLVATNEGEELVVDVGHFVECAECLRLIGSDAQRVEEGGCLGRDNGRHC